MYYCTSWNLGYFGGIGPSVNGWDRWMGVRGGACNGVYVWEAESRKISGHWHRLGRPFGRRNHLKINTVAIVRQRAQDIYAMG